MTGVATIDYSSLSDEELMAALRETDRQERELRSRKLRQIAEVKARQLAERTGHVSPHKFLTVALHIRDKTARQLLAQADLVGPRTSIQGEPLEPTLPATAVALAAGRMNLDQLDAIHEAVAHMAGRVGLAGLQRMDADLAEHASDWMYRDTTRAIRRWVATLDPDGPEPGEPLPEQTGNRLHLQPKLGGGGKITGDLDPVGFATVSKLINALNEPAKGTDGARDERTRAQRDGDALVKAARLLLDAGCLPSGGYERPTIVVNIDYQTLIDQLDTATLNTGDEISAAEARLLACDAKVLPVVMGGKSIDMGSPEYVVRGTLRKALNARDLGCSFPGCDRPPDWCHAHHILSYLRGLGPTEIWNLCLLCPEHHRLLHASEWEVEVRGNVPYFIPPAFIDPQRRPLCNERYRQRLVAA